MVFYPKLGFAILIWINTTYMKGIQIEDRGDGFELKRLNSPIGVSYSQQLYQQGGQQRAVHDKARVSFFSGGIIPIVVNTVAIKCQCRITKQQHRIGVDHS